MGPAPVAGIGPIGGMMPAVPPPVGGSRAVSIPSRLPARRAAAHKPAAATKLDTASRAARPARIRVDSAALELAITRRLAHRPLAQALARRIRKPELAERVASAVVYEAGRGRMSPSLLAAVLLIENTPFDTTAVSTQGAIGLMQVMPVHVGSYGCLSGDLLNVEANICHGARLLHSYLRRTKSVELALRRYNGCVRGRNTPRCSHYPKRVLRTASRLRHEVLASAAAEERVVTASRLADMPPSEEEADTTSAAVESNECATLLGCLKKRWSSSR